MVDGNSMGTGGWVNVLLVAVVGIFAVLFFVWVLAGLLNVLVNAIVARTKIGRWRVRALVSVILIGGVAGYCTHSYRQDERMRRESYAKAEALKAEVDAHFSAGAAQEDVVRFLQMKSSEPGASANKSSSREFYAIFVGKEPSESMFCEPRDVGVKADFANGRLVQTTVVSWHFVCL